jgi:hypothetical protein
MAREVERSDVESGSPNKRRATLSFPPPAHAPLGSIESQGHKKQQNFEIESISHPFLSVEERFYQAYDAGLQEYSDPDSTEDGLPTNATSLDQPTYLARRRILITLVSLVFLGAIALLGKAWAIYVQRHPPGRVAAMESSRGLGLAGGATRVSSTPADAKVLKNGWQERLFVASANSQQSTQPLSNETPFAEPSSKPQVSNSPATPSLADASKSAVVRTAKRPDAPANPSKAQPPVHQNRPTTHSELAPESGILVNQIYINEQGELVDAQGKPLGRKPSSSSRPVPGPTPPEGGQEQ